MPRLIKQKYYNAKGEVKINCYSVNIPKAIVHEALKDDSVNVKIYADGDRIIIEKEDK